MVHHNVEAEKMLLGCILLDNTIIKEIEIRPKHVSILHQQALEAMLTIGEDNREINPATLLEKLGSSHMAQLDLGDMMQAVPSSESFKSYESIILRSWKVSEIRKNAQQFLNDSTETISDDQLDNFISEIQEVEDIGVKTDDFNLREKLVNIFDKASSGQVPKGIPTGYDDYDRITNGHGKGQLIIVAARPSVGKTAFALNISNGHMKQGAYGHLYSLEMNDDSFLNRMISAVGRVNAEKMRDPVKRFNETDWERYTMAIGEIEKMNMYICDRSSIKISEIYARTRKLMRKYPDMDHFVVIDYMQLLRPIQRRSNRQEEVSEISRALKNMARDLNIPVIALSQLSRGVESRQDKRPVLSDIRESGSIEQDADIVAFLYRDDYYDKESEKKNIIEIIIAKQREGPVGTVELAFIKENNLFLNLERRYQY